jgi:hypothetical protein
MGRRCLGSSKVIEDECLGMTDVFKRAFHNNTALQSHKEELVRRGHNNARLRGFHEGAQGLASVSDEVPRHGVGEQHAQRNVQRLAAGRV